MAQLDYFSTLDESMAMLAEILRRGDIRAYVGQGPFDAPDAPAFSTLSTELKQRLQAQPFVFLFGNFSTHPPLFRRQQTGSTAGKYYLSESGGGPLVNFDLGRQL